MGSPRPSLSIHPRCPPAGDGAGERAVLLHTDDVAWRQARFDWDDQLVTADRPWERAELVVAGTDD
jgi:hypothetical protein